MLEKIGRKLFCLASHRMDCTNNFETEMNSRHTVLSDPIFFFSPFAVVLL